MKLGEAAETVHPEVTDLIVVTPAYLLQVMNRLLIKHQECGRLMGDVS